MQGGAKKVVAQVMSQDAKAFLNAHGIPAQAQTLVPMIINRKKTGMCPMEARVKDLTDPKEMVAALKEAVISKPRCAGSGRSFDGRRAERLRHLS